jgi:hypothetical protein
VRRTPRYRYTAALKQNPFFSGAAVRNHDLVFLKHFSMVIGFLVFVTIVLLAFAGYMHSKMPIEANPAKEAKIAARIAP